MRIEITYTGGLSGGVIHGVGKFKRGAPVSVPESIARDLMRNNPCDWDGPQALRSTETTNEQE